MKPKESDINNPNIILIALNSTVCVCVCLIVLHVGHNFTPFKILGLNVNVTSQAAGTVSWLCLISL